MPASCLMKRIPVIMSTNLITINADTRISEARELMRKHKIRHLPVTDQDGALEGIVTDRDLRDAMPSSLLSDEDYQTTLNSIMDYTVQDIMTKNPFSISPFFTIQDALILIQEKRVGAFPVVDDKGILTGILSIRDLLVAFTNVMGIGEPGTLLCILVKEETGQLKRIVDAISDEKISLGSILVARYWDKDKRAVFPYLLTNNVVIIKRKTEKHGVHID